MRCIHFSVARWHDQLSRKQNSSCNCHPSTYVCNYIYASVRGMRLIRTVHSWQRQARQYRRADIAVCGSVADNWSMFCLKFHPDSLPPTPKKDVSPHMMAKSPAQRLLKVEAGSMDCWKTKIENTYREVRSPITSQNRYSLMSRKTSPH